MTAEGPNITRCRAHVGPASSALRVPAGLHTQTHTPEAAAAELVEWSTHKKTAVLTVWYLKQDLINLADSHLAGSHSQVFTQHFTTYLTNIC